MAKSNRRDRRKEAGWRRHLKWQATSGLRIREYCRRHGLSEASFHWWKRTLAERDRASAQEADSPREIVPFARLQIGHEVPIPTMDSTAICGSGVEILVRGGPCVRVGKGFDEPTLHRVMAVLMDGDRC